MAEPNLKPLWDKYPLEQATPTPTPQVLSGPGWRITYPSPDPADTGVPVAKDVSGLPALTPSNTAPPNPSGMNAGISEFVWVGGLTGIALVVIAAYVAWWVTRQARIPVFVQRPDPPVDLRYEVLDRQGARRGGSGHIGPREVARHYRELADRADAEAGDDDAAEHRHDGDEAKRTVRTEERQAVTGDGPPDEVEQGEGEKVTNDTLAASSISDHPFTPRGEWFTTCGQIIEEGNSRRLCGLAEAAHQSTTLSRNGSPSSPSHQEA